MNGHTLAEIEAEVNRLARLIDAPPDSLPTFGSSQDSARPHIEVDGRGCHYIVVERGQELRRDTTDDLDALLYRIFEGVTFTLASHHELANRVKRQDPRRLLFAKQVELLRRLSPAWAQARAGAHAHILRDHPFRDP